MLKIKDELKAMDLANESISKIITEYNNKLNKLSEKQINTLLLHFQLKKLDTYKNMTPKGDYWINHKEEKINKKIEEIKKLGQMLYHNSSLEEIKIKNDMEFDNDLINNFLNDLKTAYIKGCKHVYTILPINGLSILTASKHRENRYLNSIKDGVFAVSEYDSIEKYICRAITGGMICRGKEIHYPSNPFKEITIKYLKLKKKVSIYISNAIDFEPQFDFDIIDNNPYFLFDGEWISNKDAINCDEIQIEYLDKSFIEKNRVFYMTKDGEKECIID